MDLRPLGALKGKSAKVWKKKHTGAFTYALCSPSESNHGTLPLWSGLIR